MSDINTDRIVERLTDTADRFERALKRGNRRAKGQASGFADGARDFLDREWSDIRRDLASLSSHADIASRPEVRELVGRIRSAMSDAGDSVSDAAEQARDQARRGAHFVDNVVQESPWRSVGVAVLAGVAVGLLINSSRR